MSVDERFYRARVTKRVDYAPDLWMVRIDPGGEFKFAPCHHYNAVGPMAGVLSPSMPVFVVNNAKYGRFVVASFLSLTAPHRCDLERSLPDHSRAGIILSRTAL